MNRRFFLYDHEIIPCFVENTRLSDTHYVLLYVGTSGQSAISPKRWGDGVLSVSEGRSVTQ